MMTSNRFVPIRKRKNKRGLVPWTRVIEVFDRVLTVDRCQYCGSPLIFDGLTTWTELGGHCSELCKNLDDLYWENRRKSQRRKEERETRELAKRRGF